MNQRNVEELEADLLMVWHDLGLCTDTWARCFGLGNYSGSVSLRLIAERLAARGVLVPSALRSDQVSAIMDVPDKANFRDARVSLLEQVATGEYLTATERIDADA